jgi:hypothetical protein
MIGLEDRIAIGDLYARQAHLIDEGDATGWADTFRDDGTFESPTYGVKVSGHAALREFAATSHTQAAARGEQLRHYHEQFVIESDNETHATVYSYLLILSTTVNGTRIDRSVTLTDELDKQDGTWLVASRRVVRDDARLEPRKRG